MSNPSVVVGISTYNRADVLPKSIQSALDQSYRPLRVSVVDDASTDDTPRLKDAFPAVSWHRWDHNRGLVRARNQMMLTASEDYYVSLDDDAWFLAGDEIAVAVNYLESNPKIAAVAFDILSPDRPQAVARGAAKPAGMFIGCGHMLRLSTIKRLLGYTTFPAPYGAEEKDICLRLIDGGYGIVRMEGLHVWHDKTTTARDLPKQHRSGVCNDLVLALMRFPTMALAPALTWKIAAHLTFAMRHRLLGPCLYGMLDFLGAVPTAWQKRRPVRSASLTRFRALTRAP